MDTVFSEAVWDREAFYSVVCDNPVAESHDDGTDVESIHCEVQSVFVAEGIAAVCNEVHISQKIWLAPLVIHAREGVGIVVFAILFSIDYLGPVTIINIGVSGPT